MADFLYGASGDIRADLNSFLPVGHANYKGEDQIPGTLIEYYRDFATDEINAVLEVRYPDVIPFTTAASVPPLINKLTNCLAAGFCMETKNPGPMPRKQDKYLSRMDLCRATLKKLAEGEMAFPSIEDPAGDIFFTHSGRPAAADVDPIENQGVSQDLLDDIDGRRGQ